MRNLWKFAGVPQTHQPISVVSGPNFTILWGHVEEILLYNNFFQIDNLQCKIIMQQEHKNTVTWNKLKQLQSPSLVSSYDLQPGNGAGLFSKEKIRKKVKKRDKWPGGSIWCKQANDIYTIQRRNRQMNQGCIMPPSENHHQAIWTGKLLTFTGTALLLALANVLQHLLHHMTVGKYTCRLDSSKIPDPRNHWPALFTQLAPVCMHYQYKQLLRVLMFWWAVDSCLHTHKYTHAHIYNTHNS